MDSANWSILAASVIGSSHARTNRPNQDAVAHYTLTGSHPAHLIAVSDGHGSDRCFRSEIGSSLAVNAATKVFIDFWGDLQGRGLLHDQLGGQESRISSLEKHIRKEVTKTLVDTWIESVTKHMDREPLPEDLETDLNLLAYGATLTVVFVCASFAIYLKLGDGEILSVTGEGTVERLLTETNDNIGEDTNSLCMKDAPSRFRILVQVFDRPTTARPDLILACTDGFSNAFKSENDFMKLAIDFKSQLANETGWGEVRAKLPEWLREYSEFSGDDVTLALLARNTSSPMCEDSSAEAELQEEDPAKGQSIDLNKSISDDSRLDTEADGGLTEASSKMDPS